MDNRICGRKLHTEARGVNWSWAMTSTLLLLVTVIYVCIALSYLFKDNNPGMAVAFAGYAIANLGFIYAGS